MSDGAKLWRRTVRRLTLSVAVANGLGGLLMFLLLGFLVPFAPEGPDRHLATERDRRGDLPAACARSPARSSPCDAARRSSAGSTRAGRPPPRTAAACSTRRPRSWPSPPASGRSPRSSSRRSTCPPTAGRRFVVGGAMLLGGETTCAVTYLLHERIIRPVTVLALAGAPAPERTGPGVSGRLAMAWSLGTGIPLLGILTAATAGMVDPDQDPALLAGAIAFLAVIGLVVGSFAISIASRSVAEPIAAVRRAMARVEEGDYDSRVPVDDGSEVGLLEAGFNSMAAGLHERERLRDLFGRHVGREVAQAALERDGDVELGGELREVAVVFVDVIGSTRLAIRRPPHEVVALLNRFFSIVVEEVEAHCGWVNKFEGDAALCVFGAPTALPGRRGRGAARGAHHQPTAHGRARGRGGRNRRVRRAGGGRQRRHRGALRVHGDRRPGQRGGPAVRAGQAALGAACSPRTPCCGAPRATRPSAGSCATRCCCAGASRRRGWRRRCACESPPAGRLPPPMPVNEASQGQDLPALRVRGGQGEDQGVRLGGRRGQPGLLRPRAGQGGRLPRHRRRRRCSPWSTPPGRSGRPCSTRTWASTSR